MDSCTQKLGEAIVNCSYPEVVALRDYMEEQYGIVPGWLEALGAYSPPCPKRMNFNDSNNYVDYPHFGYVGYYGRYSSYPLYRYPSCGISVGFSFGHGHRR